MKRIFIALSTFITFAAHAQTNSLLDQSFWQNKPDVAQVKAEVDKGSNPSQLNSNSFDPVVLAINTQAPTATIKYLLDQLGNSPDKLTHDGRTYLHWAAMRGNTEVMEYLFSKGAKASVVDSHGATPLTFAAGGGQQNTQVYDVLAAHGVNLKKEVNQEGANALLLAIGNDKDLALTQYFTGKGLDLKSMDAAGNNAFSYAARSGNMDLMKAVLQKGVPVNPTAILMAAQSGGRRGPGGAASGANLAVYQYLEGLGIKPTVTSKSGENVLHYLVRKQNQGEIIQHFIAAGVDVNKTDDEGNTPFMYAAAANRDTAVLAMLLPKVKNINLPNQKGVTALAMAVQSNLPEMVSYLINKGAAVNITDHSGNNLGYYLVQSYRGTRGPGGEGAKTDDFGAKLQILQAKGFDVKAAQPNGNTLYHDAVVKNNLVLLQRLQPLGIDINAKNKEGLTALHKAAMISKNDELMKYLISIGASKELTTNFKETAFDLASENESLTKSKVSVNFLK